MLTFSRETVVHPLVTAFYEQHSCSLQYVVTDPATKACAIIDPVLDFDEKSGTVATKSADAILAFVEERKLKVQWILDTHPHADHFSAAHYLKGKTNAPMATGERVVDVQKLWGDIYNEARQLTGVRYWDRLFAHGERLSIGTIQGRVIFSPGHTLSSITFVFGDAAFVHDTVFMPDTGTARADFPGGSARQLWRTIQAILTLPDKTRLFTGHDYRQGGREVRWESTVAEQKRSNPHVVARDEESFVTLREERDRALPMPKLILHALQVNLRGGRLPEPEPNGHRYLKIPIGAFPNAAWGEG